MAALSICEALLLGMDDRNLFPKPEIARVLCDAAATHRDARGSGIDQEFHAAAANLTDEIVAGGKLLHPSL